MGIQLDDIDYFLAVAEEGQVRKAAQRLGISQPAVTKALQRLEKELGFELFQRSVKGMTLTKVAEQFRQRTSSLRGALRDAVKEATDLHLGALGLLRVGVSPLYVQQLFVPAFLQLHRQRPAATVRASVHLNDELWRLLRQGELDLTLSSLRHAVLMFRRLRCGLLQTLRIQKHRQWSTATPQQVLQMHWCHYTLYPLPILRKLTSL